MKSYLEFETSFLETFSGSCGGNVLSNLNTTSYISLNGLTLI
jgi:hypothetical protein